MFSSPGAVSKTDQGTAQDGAVPGAVMLTMALERAVLELLANSTRPTNQDFTPGLDGGLSNLKRSVPDLARLGHSLLWLAGHRAEMAGLAPRTPTRVTTVTSCLAALAAARCRDHFREFHALDC